MRLQAYFITLIAASCLLQDAWAIPTAVSDPIAALNAQLDQGVEQLAYEQNGFGYLKAVLDRFHVSPDSQVLVFSKTSQQFAHISPSTPRAIYFNDDVAVGYVQGGAFIELVTSASAEGITFYTLDAARSDRPRFAPHGSDCARCHASVGVLVTSSLTTSDGTPLFVGGGKLFNTTDHRTPFAARWAGWYVTGTHGSQTHLGNATTIPAEGKPQAEFPSTQNLKSLEGLIRDL